MAEVQKGVVCAMEGEQVRVKPCTGGSSVTQLLKFSRAVTVLVDGEKKEAVFEPPLKVNDVVTYVAFADGTGHLLGRL